MATKFLEPGGDADFLVGTTNGFWQFNTNNAVATDFVHGSHIKSIKSTVGSFSGLTTPLGVVSDTGARISFWLYINALPTAETTVMQLLTSGFAFTEAIRITSAGVLLLRRSATGTQLGSNGSTLATGQWYQIALAYTITSGTVNRFELFVNNTSSISVTNSAVALTGTNCVGFGVGSGSTDATFDWRMSDFYIDDSSALTDPGAIRVTAKRPNANGTTNGFTTQIGAGGSGYGTGHSPQVNERPLSTTNGWSMVGAGGAVTEEYTIEGAAVGDIDISAGTIVDFEGWVSAKALASETASIIVAGVTSNISLTSTTKLFTKAAGSSTYPAGGTDIGIVTSTTVTTVSLFECGILIAFIPGVPALADDSWSAPVAWPDQGVVSVWA